MCAAGALPGRPFFLVRFAEPMNVTRKQPHVRDVHLRALFACAALLLASVCVPTEVRAQQRYSKRALRSMSPLHATTWAT